jgi:hypothetical protein
MEDLQNKQTSGDYYLDNRLRIIATAAKWNKENKKRRREILRSYRKRNAAKINARNKVNQKIRTKKQARPTLCVVNNSLCCGKVEAHHNNYAEPLNVIGLCVAHHNAWHKVFEAEK